MSKIAPRERWRRDGLERCQAFGLSTELKHLRGLGLGILGRDVLVPEEEWWQESANDYVQINTTWTTLPAAADLILERQFDNLRL